LVADERGIEGDVLHRLETRILGKFGGGRRGGGVLRWRELRRDNRRTDPGLGEDATTLGY